MGFKILKAGHVVVGTRDLACRILVRPSIQRPRCCVIGEAGGVCGGEAWEAARTQESGPFKSAQNRKLSESDGYLLVRRFAEGHFSSVAGLRVS